jgi:hypothetical protein
MAKKQCPHCRKTFTPKRSDQFYCCPEHSKAHSHHAAEKVKARARREDRVKAKVFARGETDRLRAIKKEADFKTALALATKYGLASYLANLTTYGIEQGWTNG